MVNMRGRLPLSHNHFTAVVAVKKGNKQVLLEGLADSGGAKCMMDLETAREAGLPLTYPTPTRSLGWFYGPSGEATPYAAVVEGPVEFQFSRDITLCIPELKIVKNRDPLLLIGADLMKLHDQPWRFGHVGFCPRTRCGILQFHKGNSGGKFNLRNIPLMCWPHDLHKTKHSESERHLTLLAQVPEEAASLLKEANRLRALLVERGQRV